MDSIAEGYDPGNRIQRVDLRIRAGLGEVVDLFPILRGQPLVLIG